MIDVESIARTLGAAKKAGKGFNCRCPVHDDAQASLNVAVDDDVLLVHCYAGCAQLDVLDALRSRGLMNGYDRGTFDFAIAALGKPVTVWTYRDATGARELLKVARYTTPTGKQFRPWLPNGARWKCGAHPVPRPLYGLDLLAKFPAMPVLVVEGEKACHAARELVGAKFIVTTWPGGAGGAKHADWTALRGRAVTLWPDADAPGGKAMRNVAGKLSGIATSVAIVEPGERAKGWDLADAQAEGWTGDDVLTFISAAAPKPSDVVQRGSGEVLLRRVADVEAVPINWLWPGRIARGKITMIAGHPGLGKSQLSVAIAAVVTAIGRWPVDGTSCPIGNIAMLSAEDDVADTIRPRLEAAGADVDRVEVIDGVIDAFDTDGGPISRSLNLKTDIAKLDALFASRPELAVLIVDPVTAYLGATDSHVTADVRALLAPLSALAAKYSIAVILISHLNKAGVTADALMRVTGSLAFVAAARAAFIVAKDPDSSARRLFLPAKNNVAPDVGGLAFTVEPFTLPSGIETSRILWERDPVTITADEAMAPAIVDGDRTMTEDGADLLRDVLLAGRVLARDIKRRAADAGVSDKALRNARQRLGIVVTREGFGADCRTYWSLGDGAVVPSGSSYAHETNGAQVDDEGTSGQDSATCGADVEDI